ncbi:MAG: hypothetical protein IJ302_05830 [Clostridia bacterium]|nr:hypothetical protein [Clostridia bacterium]
MKRMTMTALLLTVLLLLSAVFCACGGEETGRVTHLTATAAEIADAVRAGADFSGDTFVSSEDTDADLVLMFNYGIETDEMYNAIEDYVLSTQTLPEYPAFFSVVRVKEGTDPAVIQSIADAMGAAYAQYNIAQMVRYNPDGQSIAEGFTTQIYDNGVVVTAYDTNGNDTVLALVDNACRGK